MLFQLIEGIRIAKGHLVIVFKLFCATKFVSKCDNTV